MEDDGIDVSTEILVKMAEVMSFGSPIIFFE